MPNIKWNKVAFSAYVENHNWLLVYRNGWAGRTVVESYITPAGVIVNVEWKDDAATIFVS